MEGFMDRVGEGEGDGGEKKGVAIDRRKRSRWHHFVEKKESHRQRSNRG